jgi:hypothetical protein
LFCNADDDVNPVPFLAGGAVTLALASILTSSYVIGWDLSNSADNGGLGVPLSTEEVRQLQARSAASVSPAEEEGRVLTYEEAAEEDALVRVLMGNTKRAR